MNLASDGQFRHGIDLFNQQQFFECHEVLEELWRVARDDSRIFLQSLIHLAVAFYHHQRQNQPGAERQIRKSLRKLSMCLPRFAGVDTCALHREAKVCAEEIASGRQLQEFPRVTIRETTASVDPEIQPS